MDFSAYWKEIAIVLATGFTIVGTISEVRDRRTGSLTHWGRLFFGLTLLSMIGGFCAQWVDTINEEKTKRANAAINISTGEEHSRNRAPDGAFVAAVGKSIAEAIAELNMFG